MTRCDCCDLPPESCGKAAEQAAAAAERARRERALTLPGVVAARFPGNCGICHERYPTYTPIRHSEDGWVNVLDHPEGLDT